MSKKKFKEKKEKKVKQEVKSLRKTILDFLEDNASRAFDFKQIARKTADKNKSLNKEIFKILDELIEESKIKLLPTGSYASARKPKTVTGIVDHVNPRFAYVSTGDADTKDIYVKTTDLATALHGDTVEIEVFKRKTGANPEGEVTQILKRARTRFVGRLELSKSYAFVIPDFKTT